MSLVTGGASGLGKATVERLLQQGNRVVLCDLPSSKGNEIAKELGDNVLFAPVNVSFCCMKSKFLYVHRKMCCFR